MGSSWIPPAWSLSDEGIFPVFLPPYFPSTKHCILAAALGVLEIHFSTFTAWNHNIQLKQSGRAGRRELWDHSPGKASALGWGKNYAEETALLSHPWPYLLPGKNAHTVDMLVWVYIQILRSHQTGCNDVCPSHVSCLGRLLTQDIPGLPFLFFVMKGSKSPNEEKT